MLNVLAVRGTMSANELAGLLRVPLRSVRRLLRELQLDASVQQTKEGRFVRYAVEDTTFSEPTRTRQFEPVLRVKQSEA